MINYLQAKKILRKAKIKIGNENISIQNEIDVIRNQIRIMEDNNQSLDTDLLRKLEGLRKKVQ